jgi:hypothetical protein
MYVALSRASNHAVILVDAAVEEEAWRLVLQPVEGQQACNGEKQTRSVSSEGRADCRAHTGPTADIETTLYVCRSEGSR